MSLDQQLRNPALERLREGDVALGLVVRLGRSGDIARIAKSTGHDFLFIDMQHAIFTLETVGHIAQAALGCGITTVVRVRGVDDPNIGVLLDSGITGIVAPDVGTAMDAQRLVDRCRFAPTGKRSVVGLNPRFDFRSVPPQESVAALDRNTLVACMIESTTGVENVNEIAQVEGVDVLHIGCGDLLSDMGQAGAFGSPQIVAAIDRVLSAARANGKFCGLGGDRDIERLKGFIRGGVQFVTTESDVGLLMAAASRHTQALRAAAPQ